MDCGMLKGLNRSAEVGWHSSPLLGGAIEIRIDARRERSARGLKRVAPLGGVGVPLGPPNSG